METHYAKHHVTYTANFNKAIEKAGITETDIVKVLSSLKDVKDEADRTALINNGGGYYSGGIRYFASAFAMGQFGSGWAWLSVAPDGNLLLSKSSNQDNPISLGTGNIPILALDVWEHAYYLKYKNLRADYVKAFFEALDWEKVSARYDEAI